MMVKHPAADVVYNAVEILRNFKAPGDLDIRAHDPQQRGGKNIVGVEFAGVGKALGGDLHGSASCGKQNHIPYYYSMSASEWYNSPSFPVAPQGARKRAI